ncbi:MAG: glycosyltransferase [Flavobacteriaceae bacterium]|nr:glycosyltransferase [Flavobacteriaceae bacterium]
MLCQFYYYAIVFSRFSLSKVKPYTPKGISISVIVCAKNEAENLKTFIPFILEQEYSKFELVLINDASSDNTLEVMELFKAENDNVKIVDVKNIEAFWGNKKYALTLGIKAATYDYLLFTDADCKPVSKNWIRDMSSAFTNSKTIVLGFGSYQKIKNNFLNKVIRYETVLTAIQYFAFAKIGMPYMAVGRNLAYRKDEFFNAKGFINHMNVRSGDDDLFVNQVATKKNTALCYSKSSFTESIPEKTFKSWFRQKRRHVTAAKYYKPLHKFTLGLFYLSQLLFWILAIVLLSFHFKWQIVLGLICFRFLLKYLVYSFSAKKLDALDTLILLPLLELFLIVSQLVIFISNLTSKTEHWR